MKRVFDLAICIIALPLILPFTILCALVVRLTLGTPVFFSQERLGFRGRPFVVTKFRTMTNQRASDGSLLPDEQRLTAAGRLLRATSLDELPEVISIFRGEMSLVGPRPLHAHYRDRYNEEQFRRHEVLPGITGWAQVNGRNDISWEQKFALDVWYVDHQSFWLDLRILGKTLVKILSREGISEPGHATAQEFRGTSGKEA
jgi:sugar transferase EpsL